MLNRIIRFSLEHRLLVLSATAFLLVYGTYVVLSQLMVDIFPDLNRPTVTVFTEAPGLAPEEVEVQVTIPLEYALNGATNVERIRSQSGVGLSLLFVEFAWDSDIYRDRQIVAEKLELARAHMPAGLTPVLGPISSIMGEIMLVAVKADFSKVSPLEIRSLADWVIRPRLLAVPGVSQITVIGGGVKQYQVLASTDRLRQYNVSLHELEAAVANSNQNTSGGFLVGPNREFMIRNVGRTNRLEDIGETMVAYRNEQPIYVRDVARLQFGPPAARGSAGFNGSPAVILSVYKQPNASTIPLTNSVEEALVSLQGSFPPGVTLDTRVFRQADFIERAIDNVREGLWQGAILVGVVLFLFLWNFRTTLINITAIPTSFLITFLFMRAFDLGINTMTLGGLAVAIGLIIDDAIVDVENVYRRLKENKERGEPKPPLQVVFEASSEIRNSIVYATLIIILVFLPLFFLSGVEGRMFAPLGVAFIVSLLASLLVSLTLTPVMCYYLLPRAGFMEKPGDALIVRWLKRQQTRLLRFTLPHAWEVLIGAAFLVLFAIAFIFPMGREFLPPFNEGTLTVNVLAEPGISLPESDEIGRLSEKKILEVSGVLSTGRRTGRAELDEHAEGVYYTEIEVNLDSRARDKDALIAEIRNKLSILPGVAVNIGQPISHRLEHMQSGVRAQIAVKLFGPDLPALRQKAAELEAIMKTVPGMVDVAVEKQSLVPEVVVAVDRRRAAAYGLQVAEVNQVLETALQGRVASQVLEGQRTYDMVVRLDEPYRNDMRAIGEVLIDTPNGGKIPVRQVADISLRNAPNQVWRENAQRRIAVQANVAGRDLRSAVTELRERVEKQIALPPAYFIVYGGQFEYEQEATRLILILSVFATLGVFLMLYGHFRFARVALQIMSNVPLALVGGVIAVYFMTDGILSVASLIGFITVGGIAARNGIMMISHYIHLVRYEGEGFDEKMIVRGTLERLRPVLMTAFAAILGVLPLVFARGEAGKELLQPIATVVAGGLISSTILDWAVTPALFYKFGKPVCDFYLSGKEESEHVALGQTSASPVLNPGD
ncbi:MAG: multidrug transporter AcrB [Acidobacteria bacterium RIFCSPLOWO2_02_FULL_61_28]|nr:MAG: multidrug transporter AcrB [Acidobacteria bacterium RIFCSPLOWO2_02_FULL_61_28]